MAIVGPMMEPRLAPAMIKPYADFAPSTFMEEFTNAQNRDTQMLPNDSIAQYDTHPGRTGKVDVPVGSVTANFR